MPLVGMGRTIFTTTTDPNHHRLHAACRHGANDFHYHLLAASTILPLAPCASFGLEREAVDAVLHILRFGDLGKNLQIVDSFPDRDLELVRVNQSGEMPALTQPAGSDV